jgi:hypothetical protein
MFVLYLSSFIRFPSWLIEACPKARSASYAIGNVGMMEAAASLGKPFGVS